MAEFPRKRVMLKAVVNAWVKSSLNLLGTDSEYLPLGDYTWKKSVLKYIPLGEGKGEGMAEDIAESSWNRFM